jgi:cytochrome oxidase Cu insertion factor (SCO1/SenC/PrrC family)
LSGDGNKNWRKKKMKIGIAILCSVALLAVASGQENHPASDGVAPSLGLEIGQRAPAFALPDQFGHEQSNETLKGSKGTVLLFFRSADW